MTSSSSLSIIETDAVIVGAGPVGLFQVFELGLLEIQAHVIDSLPHLGGQCVELYPDKPIYDIPALPVCSGQELTDRLLRQIAPFGASFHLAQEVSVIEKQGDGRFLVETSQGRRFLTKTVFIAGGVGSFQPRTLRVEGVAAYEGTQVHYRMTTPAQFAGQHLLIIGSDDAALDLALSHCAAHGDGHPHKAASVTLMHRRDTLQAAPARMARLRALCDAGQMQFIVGQAVGIEASDGRLSGLQVAGNDGLTRVVPCEQVLALLGLSPKLGPIADWGLALARKQVVVDTEKFETSVPGIFAVGDVNTYPGKKKLILCGFHEATLAAFGAAAHVFPGRPIHLQYTTTSPRLHQVLGVASTEPDCARPSRAGGVS